MVVGLPSLSSVVGLQVLRFAMVLDYLVIGCFVLYTW